MKTPVVDKTSIYIQQVLLRTIGTLTDILGALITHICMIFYCTIVLRLRVIKSHVHFIHDPYQQCPTTHGHQQHRKNK